MYDVQCSTFTFLIALLYESQMHFPQSYSWQYLHRTLKLQEKLHFYSHVILFGTRPRRLRAEELFSTKSNTAKIVSGRILYRLQSKLNHLLLICYLYTYL